MDKQRITTYGGKKVHAVIPDTRITLCKLELLYGGKYTKDPVTCKRCLRAIEKEDGHA